MELFVNFIKKPFLKRILVLLIIGFGLYSVKNQITLFLLTLFLLDVLEVKT